MSQAGWFLAGCVLTHQQSALNHQLPALTGQLYSMFFGALFYVRGGSKIEGHGGTPRDMEGHGGTVKFNIYLLDRLFFKDPTRPRNNVDPPGLPGVNTWQCNRWNQNEPQSICEPAVWRIMVRYRHAMDRKTLSLFLALAAVLASIVGNLIICWQSWQFYVAVSALPPGDEVWTGGRGIHSLLVSLITFIVAMPLSVSGIICSFAQRRFSMVLVSVLAAVFALTPLPLSFWLDGKVFAVTGVTLSQ